MYLKKYVGTKEYYAQLLKIGLPIAFSILLTSCMSVVDTVMVSHIGMVTAVGNANNVLSIHESILWGITSGIAIYMAQFYGAKQQDNLSHCFAMCLIFGFLNSVFWILLVTLFGEKLLYFYLPDEELIPYSLSYLKVLSVSLIPMSIEYAFSTVYRNIHNTRLPFVLSLAKALLNIGLNYMFLYRFDFGIVGAGYGRVISQIVCDLFYILYTFIERPIFLEDFSKMFSLDREFVGPIVKKMLPVIINETLFGLGMSLFSKAYGQLGTKAMDAYYVANQIYNMFLFASFGFGSAVGIMVGTTLGKGEIEKAKKEADCHLLTAFMLGSFFVILVVILCPTFVSFFNIDSAETFEVAKKLLLVMNIRIFCRTFTYMMFSTMKAGGDAEIINFYDSGIMFLVGISLSFLTVKIGIEDIVLVVLISQAEQICRLILTLIRFKTYKWANNLTVLSEE